MNINNNLNNLGNINNLNNINNNTNDTEKIANDFLMKTEEKNSDILSSILENRKQNSKSFSSEVGNRNIQNLNTALQASSESLDKATLLLKNLKALYLNINTKNFSFDKISNLSEKTSIVIKQLKFIAKNTNLDDKPLLSGQSSEFNVYIKNKPQTLKLNFVSLLKVASTLEDIKITSMESLKEGAGIINDSIKDISKSSKKIENMKNDISTILEYYDKNDSKIKTPKQAMSILSSLKNSLLGNEEKEKSTIFKNLINKTNSNADRTNNNTTTTKDDINIIDKENMSNKNILNKAELEQKIKESLAQTELIDDTVDDLISEDDIKRTSEALKNVEIYDDTEEPQEFKFEDLSKVIQKDKEVKKENIFAQIDDEYIEEYINDKKIEEDLEDIDEIKNSNDEIDENFVALLTGRNFFKNKSKFVWTAVLVGGLTSISILLFSLFNK